MGVLRSRLDTRSDGFRANLAAMEELWDGVAAELAAVPTIGGQRYVDRHRTRGKLLVRERIEALVDPYTPFLELSPLAAWGTDDPVGAGVVTGIGIVEGTEVAITGSDITYRGGSVNPATLTKTARFYEVARQNRLPVIVLNESAGADLPRQADIFVPGGAQFKNLTQLSRLGIPTITLGFGPATAGGAYVPGMSDYVVMVKERATAYLGGPPLVKMAIDEVVDEETLGGAEMHSRTSGLSDHLALDEMDALRIGRDIVSHLQWRKHGPGPSGAGDPPRARHRRADRLRLGRRPGAVRGARDPGPHARRQPVRGVQAALRRQARVRLGRAARLPRRCARQQRHPVLRGGREGRAVHPAVQPDRHAAAVRAEHHRLHGRAPRRSRAASSRTAPSSSTRCRTRRCRT